MLIEVVKVKENKKEGQLKSIEKVSDCIKRDDIRSVRRWGPTDFERDRFGEDANMSIIYFEDGNHIKILEDFKDFINRAGAVPCSTTND